MADTEISNHAIPYRSLVARLTPREREVLGMIVAAKTTKEIARELQIAERTASQHMVHVRSKLMARSLRDVMRLAAAADREDLVSSGHAAQAVNGD